MLIHVHHAVRSNGTKWDASGRCDFPCVLYLAFSCHGASQTTVQLQPFRYGPLFTVGHLLVQDLRCPHEPGRPLP